MFYKETVFEITLGGLDGGGATPPQSSSCPLADKDDMGLRTDAQLQPPVEHPNLVNLLT